MAETSADSALIHAVETYVADQGWPREHDLILTDVLVVAVRRGFDSEGGKSQTITLTPTESSVPMLLGMTNYARLRMEKMVNESFTD